MRADVVVPEPELPQGPIELVQAVYLPLIEFFLEGAEEPLDPAVLPGAAGIDALVPDAKVPERQAEPDGGEHRLVVGPEDLGFSISPDGLEEMAQQGRGTFVPQRRETERQSTPVLDDPEERVQHALSVGRPGEIHPPEEVPRDPPGPGVLDLAAQHLDFVLMVPNDRMDERLAQCYLLETSEPPVEGGGDPAAAWRPASTP